MYLFGASGHGKVIKEILQANGKLVTSFVDDNLNLKECAGSPVLHNAVGLSPIIVSIGNNHTRKAMVKKLMAIAKRDKKELKFITTIHPSAIISPSAKIGEGTVVMAGAVINADAVIGKHCIINTGASIDHECVIGDYCHIAPGTHISGNVLIGDTTWIGVGTCIIQGIKIGKNCLIGAGSVVVHNIPDNMVAYGNPCKVVRNNEL